MERVAYVRVSTQARGGATKMEYEEPAYNPAFPDAAQVSSVFYDSTCGTNDILWTIVMKNGDELRLRQYISIIPQPEKNYYSADYDMTTMEALYALLEEIEATETPDTLVSIYLPPVVYRHDLYRYRRRGYGVADRGELPLHPLRRIGRHGPSCQPRRQRGAMHIYRLGRRSDGQRRRLAHSKHLRVRRKRRRPAG